MPTKIEKGKSVQRAGVYRDAVEADCYSQRPNREASQARELTLASRTSSGVIGETAASSTNPWAEDRRLEYGRPLQAHHHGREAHPPENGPVGGKLEDCERSCDTLVASADIVACDA